MPVPSRTWLLATLVAAAACRSISTGYTPGALWQPGAPAVVLPARAGSFDPHVVSRVAARLRSLGGVRLLPSPPGLVEGADDDQRSCELARQAGARYLVLATGSIHASRTEHCLVSTGILRHIVIPIVIPLPLPGGRARILTGTIENPLGVEDSCVNEPSYDLEVLDWQIGRATPDLFPSQSLVVRAEDGRGVAIPSRGIDAREVFEIRKPSDPDSIPPLDELAYVRRVEGDQIVVEPYSAPIDLAPGDVLIRRGRVNWIELSPFASASMLSVDGEHALLAGGGGRRNPGARV